MSGRAEEEPPREYALADALTFRLHFGPPLNEHDLAAAEMVRSIVGVR